MKAPDCIQCVCRDYRKLFASDEAMAKALNVEVGTALAMLSGNFYPRIDEMVVVQEALRRAAAARPLLD